MVKISINRPRCSGQAMIEFVLAAIPIIFVMISVEEIARGMWIYVTLAHAIKEGTRYSVVHGGDCVHASSDCQATVGQVASLIATAGVGLDASRVNVLLETASTSRICAPLSACLSVSDGWPPSPDNSIGLPVTITGTYRFNNAISMFVPQHGSIGFASLLFGAESQAEVQY